MKRTMMHAKIHRATVTDACVEYEGSITVDADLLEAAGMLPYEQVQVLDVDNGVRLETYLMKAEAGSGDVIVNGAAARLVNKGDKVIIVAYAQIKDKQAQQHRPRIVLVDESNRPVTSHEHSRPSSMDEATL